jgi:uncharacterized protein (TIGR02444 family)
VTEQGLTDEALWPYALALYGRPGAEPLLLELQDAHGQCVPFLIWSLWLAAGGRRVSASELASGCDLARAWLDAAVTPLRRLRRELKAPGKPSAERARGALRGKVAALELEAERMLLQMLQDASAGPGGAPTPLIEGLEAAVRAWGAEAPRGLLERLAAIAA